MTTSMQMLSYAAKRESYQVPRYPIVLCHGFSGFDHMFSMPAFTSPPPVTDTFRAMFQRNAESGSGTAAAASTAASPAAMGVDNKSIAEQGKYLFEYWNGVKQNLEGIGCTVLIAKVPPFGSIQTRATALDTYIRSAVPALRRAQGVSPSEPVKINLVAHSMGGLDCRYLIHSQQRTGHSESGYKVVSLTTIATPHAGTAAADFALAYSPTSLIRNYFPSVYQLTTRYAEKFNGVVKDDPDVSYYSYAAQFRPIPGSMFLVTWKIVFDSEGENDGLVSVKSAQWGKYMGCLDDVDHADLINWVGLVKKAKMVFGVPNFNPDYFYLDVADNLARNGF